MKTKSSRRAMWLILLVLLASSGLFWYRGYAARQHQARYDTRALQTGDVSQEILTTGNLQPVHTVAIGSQVSGIIQKLNVEFNSVVHKGEVIALVDPSTFLMQKQQAVADLDSANAGVSSAAAGLSNAESNLQSAASAVATAQAAVQTARVGIISARAQVEQARAGVNKSKATLASNNLTYHRSQTLRQRDLIAQADLDTARTGYLTSAADVQTSSAALAVSSAGIQSAQVGLQSALTGVQVAQEKRDAASSQVAAARSQLAAAQSTVKKAQAEVELSDVNLGYCIIKSPVDGVVISRNVDPGQTIAASFQSPTLFSLATDLRHMQVLANVDESDMSQVFQHQKCTFTVDAFPDDTFDGVVHEVRNASTMVNNVVTYQVLIDVENPRLKLRPGMTANISLLVKSKKNVLLVPNMALRFRPDDQDVPTTTPAPSASVSASASPSSHHHHHHDGADMSNGPGGHPKKSRGKVWVLDKDKPVPVEIQTGITDGTNTEVVSGLAAGQQVIVANLSVGPSTSPAGNKKRLF